MNQRELMRKIRSYEEDMTDTQLFHSEAYADFLHTIISGITEKCRREIKLLLEDSASDEMASYTDGNQICINLNYKYISPLARNEKNAAYIAVLLHEAGHILLTPFGELTRLTDAIRDKNGQSFFGTPAQDHVKEVICQGKVQGLAELYHRVFNIAEDGYIDYKLMKLFPGYGINRKWYRDEIMTADMEPYEEWKDHLPLPVAVINALTAKIKSQKLRYHKADEVIKKIEGMQYLYDSLYKADNRMERTLVINEIFAQVFEIIEDEYRSKDNPQREQNDNNAEDRNNGASESGSDKGGSGSPDNGNDGSNASNSPESPHLPQIDNFTQGMDGSSPKEENGSNAPNSTQNGNVNNNGQVNGPQAGISIKSTGMDSVDIKSLSSSLQQIGCDKENFHINADKINPISINELELNESPKNDSADPTKISAAVVSSAAKEQAARDQEKDIEQKARQEMSAIAGIHQHIKGVYKRPVPSSEAICLYEAEHNKLDVLAKRMAQTFSREIDERKTGDRKNGLYMGKKLDSHRSYRKDSKIFYKNTLPEDIPDMKVCLLIDLSGSMRRDSKIITARNAAYILYQFCNIMQVPCDIYGHRVNEGNKVEIFCFTKEESVDHKDPIRIFDISPGGRNRDGYAIQYCVNQLKEADESLRILFIISDGKPNDGEYSGEIAYEDIRNIVADAKKIGIDVITAGIGKSSDVEQIRRVYTENVAPSKAARMIDMTDLEKLPKLFPTIIKRMLD